MDARRGLEAAIGGVWHGVSFFQDMPECPQGVYRAQGIRFCEAFKEEAQSMKEPVDKVMGWIDELENTGRGPGESTLRAKQKREVAKARRVVIDEDECVLCGSCLEICPEVFAIREDAGAAVVIKETGGREDLIQDAIDSCPVQCIAWER